MPRKSEFQKLRDNQKPLTKTERDHVPRYTDLENLFRETSTKRDQAARNRNDLVKQADALLGPQATDEDRVTGIQLFYKACHQAGLVEGYTKTLAAITKLAGWDT